MPRRTSILLVLCLVAASCGSTAEGDPAQPAATTLATSGAAGSSSTTEAVTDTTSSTQPANPFEVTLVADPEAGATAAVAARP